MNPDDLKDLELGRNYAEGLPTFEGDEPSKSDPEQVVQEKLRRRAFSLDAVQLKDHHYWDNYIQSKSEARKLENQMRQAQPKDLYDDAAKNVEARVESKRKRKSKNLNSTSRLPTPDSMPRKKNKGTNVRPSIEISDNAEDSSRFVRQSRSLSDPFRSSSNDENDDGEDDEDAKLEKIRQKNLQQVKDNLPQ